MPRLTSTCRCCAAATSIGSASRFPRDAAASSTLAPRPPRAPILCTCLQREFHWADMRTLYIHPVTTAIPSTSVGFIKDLEGATTRTVTSEDISFHAVREYAAGDAQRHIHWKSTAKTGTLMVRQFEETRRSTISLVLDLNAASYASDDEFEMAVSVIGSLGRRARCDDGRDVQAVTSGEVPEFARATVRSLRQLKVTTPRALLDDLAGVASGHAVVELPAITRMVAETRADTSLAFLVTGSRATLATLQSAALAFPVDVAVAAVICDPNVRSPRSSPWAVRACSRSACSMTCASCLRRARAYEPPAAQRRRSPSRSSAPLFMAAGAAMAAWSLYPVYESSAFVTVLRRASGWRGHRVGVRPAWLERVHGRRARRRRVRRDWA